VQLYVAGTSGNGSTPTVTSKSITTDGQGVFAFTDSFSCPYSDSVLYVVARGGHAGSSGVTNIGTTLVAVLGPCGVLGSLSPVVVNEATTVAATWGMAQFLGAGGQIGTTAGNGIGLRMAAATSATLVNLATGTAPGSLSQAAGTATAEKINALANMLNACIVSSGPGSSPCVQLYTAASAGSSPSTNTLDAALNVTRHPGNNVAAIFGLSSGSRVFQPALAAAPADWTLSATYTGGGMDGPAAVSIDSQGNVWVANYFSVASLFSNTGKPASPNGYRANGLLLNSYGGAVDVNDIAWIANEQSSSGVNRGLGSIALLNSSGTSPALFSAGGLNFPIAVAFDTSGNAWIANYGNSSVTLLNSSGSPLSGTSGFSATNFVFPVAIAADSKCNAFVANLSSNTITRVLADGSAFTDFAVGSGPSGIAIDAADNVWVANFYGNTVGLLSPELKILSGSGYAAASLQQPQGIALDGVGNAWIASYRGSGITELSSATGTTPGALLSPSTGWGQDAKLLEPYALAIDASGNIWVSNFGSNTITEFIGLAAPVKTPLLGPVRVP
jgi:streptogramin lyase